jgi:hypothetical protein
MPADFVRPQKPSLEWDLLTDDNQEAFRARLREEKIRSRRAAEAQSRVRGVAAFAGGLVAVLVGWAMGIPSVLFLLVFALVGGVVAWCIAWWQIGQIAAIFLVGGSALVASFTAMLLGHLEAFPLGYFLALLMHTSLGPVLALWVERQYDRIGGMS